MHVSVGSFCCYGCEKDMSKFQQRQRRCYANVRSGNQWLVCDRAFLFPQLLESSPSGTPGSHHEL
jgi:hypothetical protein